jgi:hypothetical protein
MHLEGHAAHWFQLVERRLLNASWSTFCEQLHDRFDRDQQEALIHQFFKIYTARETPAMVILYKRGM